jgi:hypothetical protein
VTSSVPRASPAHRDARPVLLAVAIAHQARSAAERAATARDVIRALAARRAAHRVVGSLDVLERLVLADRNSELAAASRHNLVSVAGTVTPAERAWVLAWHLLAATARLHSAASAGGRPIFGERESGAATTLTRQALDELETLVRSERRLELRADLTPATLSLDAQLELFAPVLPRRRSLDRLTGR